MEQKEPKDSQRKRKVQRKSKLTNSNDILKNLKSDYFLRKFFDYIPQKISLKMISYNKSIQKRIDININHYKLYSEKYSSIEIEIIPKKNAIGSFIDIKEEDKKYYHIYFNDNKKEEIKSTFLNGYDNISKINIIIDYHVSSLSYLFNRIKCIEFINFKTFIRNNITDMSYMFNQCSSLKELNLKNFNTNSVTSMCSMFSGCTSLNELNLNNFNTKNVTKMNCMFSGCSSLKELKINNFITNKVT